MNNRKGYTLVEVIILIAIISIIVMVIVNIMTGESVFSYDEKARNALIKSGYEEVEIDGISMLFDCGNEDGVAINFKAKNPKGMVVNGVACCSNFGGCSISF